MSTSDFGRYEQDEPGGDFYWAREVSSMSADSYAVSLHIDRLGKVEKVAIARPGMFSPEEIAALPTQGEAIAFHLRPGLDRAEANRKAWLRAREKEPKPEPQPPPMDPATRRFLGGG
jgi:hypothetical protein